MSVCGGKIMCVANVYVPYACLLDFCMFVCIFMYMLCKYSVKLLFSI